MNKKNYWIIISSVIICLFASGCSGIKDNIKEISEAKEEIKEGIKEVSELKDDITEAINTEVTENENTSDVDNSNNDGDNTSNITDEDEKDVHSEWSEIAQYKVTNIIEEKVNPNAYILAYISEEETANLIDYFDNLLKGTPDYSCKKVTTISGYLRGTINDNSIIVEVGYDNVKDENRVDFTSYKK